MSHGPSYQDSSSRAHDRIPVSSSLSILNMTLLSITLTADDVCISSCPAIEQIQGRLRQEKVAV